MSAVKSANDDRLGELVRRAKIAQFASLVTFILPWVTVSCSGQTVTRLSGFDLAKGSAKVHDPFSGAVELHSFAPSLIVWAAMLLIVVGIATKMVMTARRASTYGIVCSAAALALIAYEACFTNARAAGNDDGFSALAASVTEVQIAFGFWMTCAALAASLLFNKLIWQQDSDSASPKWGSRMGGLALVIGSFIFPALFSGAFAAPPIRRAMPSPLPSIALAAASKGVVISPLTTKEIRTGIEAGLGCDFSIGKNTLFVIVSGEALAKPNGVLHHFRLSDDRSLAIINYGGAIGDGEWRILIDRDEKVIRSGEELTARNARLTVRSKRGETTVVGRWTCGA